ncbi:MAG: Histidine kinase [Pseudobdellovibrio sp.]|jgi:hypothetical protein|nr:Histidine kinase [Pseudobdellovibrio sp.]
MAKKKTLKKVKLLAGRNPQIAKGDGDAPVKEYISAIPDKWKQDIASKLDKLIVAAAPKVKKAVKWNSPFYGIEGQGWFLNFHCFTKYVKVGFFKGSMLKPLPPGESKSKEVRYIDIYEGEKLNETQFKNWVKQASKIPGWQP